MTTESHNGSLNNNRDHVLRWEGNRWYPAVVRADKRLTEEMPGYTIIGIHSRFGGLEFIYDLPDEIDTDEYRARADKIVCYAKGWVVGFEYAQKEGEKD